MVVRISVRRTSGIDAPKDADIVREDLRDKELEVE